MSRARHRFLDELAERFASHGAEPYGEAVSQAEHALQCATLAERAGCSDSLVVAALLHDIGHLYEDPAQIDEEDLRHEEFGARCCASCSQSRSGSRCACTYRPSASSARWTRATTPACRRPPGTAWCCKAGRSTSVPPRPISRRPMPRTA